MKNNIVKRSAVPAVKDKKHVKILKDNKWIEAKEDELKDGDIVRLCKSSSEEKVVKDKNDNDVNVYTYKSFGVQGSYGVNVSTLEEEERKFENFEKEIKNRIKVHNVLFEEINKIFKSFNEKMILF